MQRCDVCDGESDAFICDECAYEINHRVEDDRILPRDDRISPDPEYIWFYQKNGYWQKQKEV